MKAKLYNDGELIGHCEANLDTSVIIFGREYYVFNAQINGYEYAKVQRVHRIEYTPQAKDKQPELAGLEGPRT